MRSGVSPLKIETFLEIINSRNLLVKDSNFILAKFHLALAISNFLQLQLQITSPDIKDMEYDDMHLLVAMDFLGSTVTTRELLTASTIFEQLSLILSIFKGELLHYLDENERVEADDGYSPGDPEFVKTPSGITHADAYIIVSKKIEIAQGRDTEKKVSF